MKDKLIINHNEIQLELNLSRVNFTLQEENPRYSDDFRTKFTFPFEFELSRDLQVILGDFSSINYFNLETRYEDCHLILDGRVNKAKLEILGSIGNVIRAQIDIGYELFPNWEKQLRDLPLEIVTSSTDDMRSVAEATITKSYPTVNYNFPMIHTNDYDDKPGFEHFQGIINKRVAGQFIENESVPSSNDYYNRNIVIPMPYWLHVLKSGFEDAGFSLHGDVLEDPELIRTLIAPARAVELFDRPESIEWFVGIESFTPGDGNYGVYESIQSIEINGKFRVRGFGRCTHPFNRSAPNSWYPKIYFNDELVFSRDRRGNYDVDFVIETISGEMNQLKFTVVDVESYEFNRLEVQIIPQEIYSENGEIEPELANFTRFELASFLPDQTFGHFVTCTKNLLNMDMDIRNNTEVWMNYIERSFNDTEMKDLSKYEVELPERIYNESKSFLLTYKEIDSEEYSFTKVYYDRNGMQTENYTKNEQTNVIEIQALPLPIRTLDSIATAHQFFQNESVYQILMYSGLSPIGNTADWIAPWSLDVIFNKHWSRWLKFRVFASRLRWRFIARKNHLRSLKINDNIYAYRQKIWIRSQIRTSINERDYEVEIECDVVRN